MALHVLDAPRKRRIVSDDLLSVVQFAGGSEVLTAPRRLDVEDLPVAGFLKNPLVKFLGARQPISDVDGDPRDRGQSRHVPLGWVHCGTDSQ